MDQDHMKASASVNNSRHVLTWTNELLTNAFNVL